MIEEDMRFLYIIIEPTSSQDQLKDRSRALAYLIEAGGVCNSAEQERGVSERKGEEEERAIKKGEGVGSHASLLALFS